MIQNKLEKFLALSSSLFLLAAIVLGIKVKDDDKKLDKLENSVSDRSASLADILETQKQIMASREGVLDKIAGAAAPDTTRTVTTKAVVPGKVVTQKVPVTSKTTKTS